MMRLKDESFFLHIGQPLVLEFDSIKKPANPLNFNKGFIDPRRYSEFWVKRHCCIPKLFTNLFSLFKFIRTVPFSVLHRDGLNAKTPEFPTLLNSCHIYKVLYQISKKNLILE